MSGSPLREALVRANGAGERLSVQDGAKILEHQVNRLLEADIPPLCVVDMLCELIACTVAQTGLASQRDYIVRTILANLPAVVDRHLRLAGLDMSTR